MGVRNLWQVLTPVGNKSSLTVLQDKQIAVDLSCWFYQHTKWKKDKEAVILRNIFLRTKILLMMNVKPVFVLDGDAPNIKHETLQRRVFYKTRRKGESQDDVTGKLALNDGITSRSYLTECCKLLTLLGVTCLKSVGEGEALCAQLDKQGIVDGVITQDNDAFLYGARKIYKNFCKHGSQGSVEVFEMSQIESRLNLTREKLIAMSLLCGCDFHRPGVAGVGHAGAVKYLANFRGNVLERLNGIRSDRVLRQYEMQKRRESRNSGFEHGKLLEATSRSSSYDELSDEDRETIDFELKLYRQAATHPDFPDRSVVEEYSTFCQDLPAIHVDWDRPQIIAFVDFMKEKCGWNHNFSFKIILPLYCRWSLLNSKFVDYKPAEILRRRTVAGVACLDVEWTARIDPRSLVSRTDVSCIYRKKLVTVEPEDLVADKCRELYESFASKMPKKARGKAAKGAKEAKSRKGGGKCRANECNDGETPRECTTLCNALLPKLHALWQRLARERERHAFLAPVAAV